MRATFIIQAVLLVVFQILTVYTYGQSQEPVDVTDQTIKLGGTKEEEIYLGFAEGDKVIFNFIEVNGKELKEIEVLEYPGTSKFSDFKTSKIESKQFNITRQSIYIFRFKNSSLSGRICKIKVQRIPANSSTLNFNTAVTWVNRQDTTWNSYTKDVVVGYDTVYEQKTKKELISSEQKEELIIDKTERVHSTTNANSSRTSLFFTLPANSTTGNTTKNVIAWAYWVGVGEEANEAWQKNAKVIQGAVKTGAAYFTTPLGALAIGTITSLLLPSMGEDVYYAIADQQNRNQFLLAQPFKLFDEGKGVAGYKKFTQPGLCQGTWFICLSNDNLMQGIDATVKVIAIVETKTFEDRAYTDMIVKPKYEKKIVKDPVIKTSLLPVTGN